MKKVNLSSFGSLKKSSLRALFALMLFVAFIGVQTLAAQVIQGPPPDWMTPAEANALLAEDMASIQADLNALPPGPAATALSNVLTLYDLIQAKIIELDKVGESVYAAFAEQFGQVPVVYASGSTPSVYTHSNVGSTVTYSPQLQDAFAPNPSSPNYVGILELYEEVSDRLSY